MDLAGIDLVEELHHDEGVEDDGVVLRGGCVQGGVPPAVYIKYLFTNEQQGKDDSELVDSVS